MLPKLAVVWTTLAAAVAPVLGQRVPVTGARVNGNGPVPLRQNINNLQAAGGPSWDIYLRSLRAMYDTDASNQLSFFQLGGIHGRPYNEWNNAGPRRSTGWAGYCPHGERIFLTWHRPYMALFEQELVRHARRLAAEYPPAFRAQYTQAAERLRMPYWDWAADQSVPPATIPARVRVNVPNGQGLRAAEIDNPLATYRIPRAALAGQFGTFDTQNRAQILHCPSPENYPVSANRNLQSRPYKQWVYEAFTRSRSFDEFAIADGSIVGIEQSHNGIHWDSACGNQFLDLDFSAYDPLFPLHHCNTDRLWAYWEAMHPESAVFNVSYRGGSRFSTPGGATITPDSPLEPFFQPNGAFHTSRSVANIRNFGYTYQGLEYWQKSEAQMRQDATKLINQLYSPGILGAGRLSVMKPEMRFSVTIKLNMSEVERPCTVNVYIAGKPAGNFVVMDQPSSGTMKGGLGLDDAIRAAGLRNSSAPDETLKSVRESLAVTILKRDGTPVPLTSVPSLKVQVENISVQPASTEDQLPTFGDPKRHDVPPKDHSKHQS